MFFLGLPQGPVAEVKSGSTRSPRTCCFASWKKFMNRFRMTGCFAYLLRVTSKTRLGLEELGPRQQSDVSHRFGRRLASTTLKPCFFGHFVGGGSSKSEWQRKASCHFNVWWRRWHRRPSGEIWITRDGKCSMDPGFSLPLAGWAT